MQPDPDPIPVATLQYASPSGYAGEALWREGRSVVSTMSRERAVHLPDRCVKCNAAAADQQPWKKTLYWHPPAIYAVILINVLIYAIVALSVRKKVIVTASLCAVHREKRRNSILIGWGIFLASLVTFGAAIFFSNDPSYRYGPLGPVCIVLGIVLVLTSALWAIFATRVIAVRKIADYTVWFSGAGPEFLASLPGN